MRFGQPWSCYWGDPENWINLESVKDFITGCKVTFSPITMPVDYPQYFKFVVDGRDQGAPFYMMAGQTSTITGNYTLSSPHVFSIVGQGDWSTDQFDATLVQIAYLSTRATDIHLEITANPDEYSIESSGTTQFSSWALTGISRFANCRPSVLRPTWGEMDLTMTTVGGVHTVSLGLNGSILASGSRSGNGSITINDTAGTGISGTVSLTYTGDIASGAQFIAAFPAQYNIFYRSSGAWTGADFYTVSAATWSVGVATLTIGAHSLTVGTAICVTGIAPFAYNMNATITAVTATTIKYVITANPGSYSSGGTVSTPTAVIYDDGHSASYAYTSGTLAGGTWYTLVHQVNAEFIESTGTTNQTVATVTVPAPPTALALNNATGDIIQWIASTTASATYNIYDSGSGGVVPIDPTTTHASGSGTLTKSLAALVGFTGTRFILIHSVLAGVEDAFANILNIPYVNGVAQFPTPNTPYPGTQIVTDGLQLTVPWSLATMQQAVPATQIQLFAATTPAAIDYTSPLATLTLSSLPSTATVALRIYGSISGTVGSAGLYYYALRTNSANGQSTNVDYYGPVRLNTTAPGEASVIARPGI